MNKIVEVVKKPVVWISGLVVAAIGGIVALVLNRK